MLDTAGMYGKPEFCSMKCMEVNQFVKASHLVASGNTAEIAYHLSHRLVTNTNSLSSIFHVSEIFCGFEAVRKRAGCTRSLKLYLVQWLNC